MTPAAPFRTAPARTSPLLLAGIIAAILMVLLVAGGVAALLYVRLAMPLDFEPVDAIEREPTVVLRDRTGQKLATRLAPGPRIAELLRLARTGKPGARNLIDAVIAMEDRDFWTSDGVRVTSIAKAALVEGRGGSTIPMQVIKNVYWRAPPAGAATSPQAPETRQQRLVRKFQEILFSPDLEARFSRQDLLGVYFRLAPDYGSDGRGFERAALLFYGVYPEDLTAAQAASLAATLRAPFGYDPRDIGVAGRQPYAGYAANGPLTQVADCTATGKRLRNNRCRALAVLDAMAGQLESGPGAVSGQPMLTPGELARARRDLLTLGSCDDPRHMAQQRALGLRPPDEERCRRTPRQFIDLAMDQVAALGITPRPRLVLDVRTTFDRASHQAMVRTMNALRACRFPPSEIGMASFSRDGQLLATLELPSQGLADGPDEQDGYFGIPPGSTLKPFLFGAYLAADPTATPDTLVEDSDRLPAIAQDREAWPQLRQGQAWWPNRGDPPRLLSLRAALADSSNRVAVRLGAALGPRLVGARLAAAGIHFHGRVGSAETTAPHAFPTSLSGLWPMALLGEGGAARVRPLELIGAYTTFANAGVASRPRVVARVSYVAPDGRQRLAAAPPRVTSRVFAPAVGAQVGDMMAAVVSDGTASGLPLAALGVRGKTGTVSKYRYGWFIGYQPGSGRVTGVWLNAPAVTVGGRGPRRLQVKGRDAARIAAALIGAPGSIGTETICPAMSRELGRKLDARRAGDSAPPSEEEPSP